MKKVINFMNKIKRFFRRRSVSITACVLMVILGVGVYFVLGQTKTSVGNNMIVLGGLQLTIGGGSKPTCDTSTRGMMWAERGGTDAGDTFVTCMKKSDGLYAWEKVLDYTIRPFGENPGSLNGVSFYDGTSVEGMIVFKTPGSYSITPEMGGDVEVLVVGGGGGGGHNRGGGGGAGGLLYNSSFAISETSITVTVGDYGAGRAQEGTQGKQGADGGNSVFSALTAIGGGGGGGNLITAPNGRSGGSGGGAGHNNGTSGTGTAGQGNNGGTQDGSNAGGGGGAGGVGGNAAGSGGTGGTGKIYFGYTYATGGKGGSTADDSGAGGTANTGNGGAGAGDTNYTTNRGGHGGSGIVIVRWGGYNKNYNPTTNAVW